MSVWAILKGVIIIVSIIVWAVNRAERSTTINDGSLRSITPEELAAVEALLQKPVTEHRVFLISGVYDPENKSIAEIELVFPYDAENYLLPGDNTAEVVIIEGDAIILKLNESFILTQVELPEPEQHYDIVSERNETENEVLQRRSPNLGIFSTIFLIITFSLLFTAIINDGQLRLAFVSGSLFSLLLALFTYYKKSNHPAENITKIKGILTNINRENSRLEVSKHFIFNYPYYWESYINQRIGSQLDIDVRGSTGLIIRLGRTLSINDEVQQKQPKYFTRHILLITLGIFALVTGIVLNGDRLESNFLFTQTWLKQDLSSTPITPMEQLTKTELSKGMWIKVAGKAACQVNSTHSNLFVNCKTLRWNGNKIEQSRHNNNFSLEGTLLVEKQISADLVQVKSLSTLINTVNEFCSVKEYRMDLDCLNLKSSIRKTLNNSPSYSQNKPMNTWYQVLEINDIDDFILHKKNLDSLKKFTVIVSNILIDKKNYSMLKHVYAQQKGGILIKIIDSTVNNNSDLNEKEFLIEGLLVDYKDAESISIDTQYKDQLNQEIPTAVLNILFLLLSVLLVSWQMIVIIAGVISNIQRNKLITEYYDRHVY